MRVRKWSAALSHLEVCRIIDTWHYARKIGLPLNAFITIRPANTDSLTPPERCKVYLRIKNKYGEFARRHGFAQTYIWTREIAPDGTREHLHLLCHVPCALLPKLLKLASGWMPLPGESDARPASQKVKWTPNGKAVSVITYIVKQMTPQAVFRRSYRRRKGGKILGDRCGFSRNMRKLPM